MMLGSDCNRAAGASYHKHLAALHTLLPLQRLSAQVLQRHGTRRIATATATAGSTAGHAGSADFRPAPGKAGDASFGSPIGTGGSGGSKLGRLREQLQRYGLAGLLAYGLLNTLYYSFMFLFVWVYVVKVPPSLGVRGAALKFLEVFALTWGGSQVTKMARAAGAVALAPLVDGLLDRVQGAARLRSKRAAFFAVVGACVAVALLLFAGVVAAYA